MSQQHSPHRHLVPKGMRPRQRAELKVDFPTRRSHGLAEALREALEEMQSAPQGRVDDPTLPRRPKKKN